MSLVLHRGHQHTDYRPLFSLDLGYSRDYLRSLAKDEKGSTLSVLYGSAALYSTYERRLRWKWAHENEPRLAVPSCHLYGDWLNTQT